MVGSLGSTESDDTAQRLVSAVVRDPGAAASQYTLQWALLCTRYSGLYSVHTAVGSTRYCTRYSGLYMLLYTLRRALLCTRYSGLYAAHATVGSTRCCTRWLSPRCCSHEGQVQVHTTCALARRGVRCCLSILARPQEIDRQDEQRRVFEQTRSEISSSKAPYHTGAAAAAAPADPPGFFEELDQGRDSLAPDADEAAGSRWGGETQHGGADPAAFLEPEVEDEGFGLDERWEGHPVEQDQLGDQPPQQTVFLDDVYPQGYSEIFDANLNELSGEAIHQVPPAAAMAPPTDCKDAGI